jgi:hypothetical protein
MRLVTSENLPENECWELLRTQSLGLVAVSLAALPAIVAVAYSVNDAESTISFQALQAIPKKTLDDAVIAFEVDALDPRTHQGWIVHIVGSARVSATNHDHDGAVRRAATLAPTMITGERLQDG